MFTSQRTSFDGNYPYLVNDLVFLRVYRNSGFGASSDVSNIGCHISYVFVAVRSVRVRDMKRPQKNSNICIFWDCSKVKDFFLGSPIFFPQFSSRPPPDHYWLSYNMIIIISDGEFLFKCRIDLLNFSMGFNIIAPYMEFLHLNWYIAECNVFLQV